MVSYVDMGTWPYCYRVGIGTEGVGGVLVILFKNHSESENIWFELYLVFHKW